MAAARGEARKAASSATSSGRPGRPIGMPPSESISILRPPSSSVPASSAIRRISAVAAVVSMKPGAIAFTRMPFGPTSLERPLL